VLLSADWVLPVSGPPIENGAVVVEEGGIVAVGRAAELGQGEHYPGAAILPGFVNAHSHLEYAVYAGFGDGLAFVPWIVLHTERKARLETEDMEDVARLGAAECLASGITTVGDASFRGAAATACAELGLRAIVYLEVFGRGLEQIVTRFEAHRDRIADLLSDRVQLGISPHAAYTCSLELYQACRSLGLPLVTHLAEGANEDDWIVRGEGEFAPFADLLARPLETTAIRALAEAGLLDARVLAVHCVTADAEEIELLARHNVAVAHCPRSNALLGCGVAPLRELRAAGLRVGLGTDSPASTPSFDMFDELRAAVYLARAREGDPSALGAEEALELATLGSAQALGLAGEIGSLEPGKRADLTVVSLEGSPFVPWEDPAAAVVLGGSPDRVLTTLVEGQVRYARGDFEWHELRQRGASARGRLLARAGRPEASPAAPGR
jgi:cytosine/adenosine deaminase-related metal-dependent hydrolase